MDLQAVIARAEVSVGKGIRYKLGKGGMNPGSPLPSSANFCDCSGFVAWCFFMSRKTNQAFYVNQNGGWIETSAVWKDIGSSVGIFEPLERPKRGAVVVFPDSGQRQGHIGLVTGPNTVIHCSMGNDRRTGDAIQETDMSVFGSNSRFGWLVGLD